MGSIEPGKLADLVVWSPSHFGLNLPQFTKTALSPGPLLATAPPVLVVANLCVPPRNGAHLGARPRPSVPIFIHPLALDARVPETACLIKPLLPLAGTRTITKRDMLHNDACPDITVNLKPSRYSSTVSWPRASRRTVVSCTEIPAAVSSSVSTLHRGGNASFRFERKPRRGHLYRPPGSCLSISCHPPFYLEGDPQGMPTLYLQSVAGRFVRPGCGELEFTG